ncbi:MAG: HlyD family type I secretion periplasmic adaptor subunit [Anderseniella sp.]
MVSKNDDLDYATEYTSALHSGVPKSLRRLVIIVLLMIAVLVGWANWAQLDEVARGEGRVVASGRNQLLQSLEGGIVEEILVKTGDHVKRGDVLVRINDIGFSSDLGEIESKRLNLMAQIARLEHETDRQAQGVPEFPALLQQRAPKLVESELRLFKARRQSLNVQINILNERVQQKQRELAEIRINLRRLEANLKLALEEEEIKAPLAKSGVVPKTDVIRLQREISDLRGQIDTAKESIPRLEAGIREAEGQVEEQRLRYLQEAQAELGQRLAEQAIVTEAIRAARDKVQRADIRAPVDGIVNALNANTVGGVVRAGEILAEIVPLEAALRVEARIKPSDIAFVHPQQEAMVKITAYDFSIYGGLDGVVEKISPDSSVDEATREVFYTVTIKTLQNELAGKKQRLSIFPGMVASVDILTGKKSVLDYLLKPINKAREEALRER